MDEFTGVMAVGTGWVAILMPVLISLGNLLLLHQIG